MTNPAMSTRGRAIVKSEGWAHMKVTARCNDTTVLYPGLVVTRSGETAPDVALIDGTTEIPFCVLGLPANHDIDTNFADNDEVVSYLIGSGAVVLMKKSAACLVTAGEKMYADLNANTGYVTPKHRFLVANGDINSATACCLAVQSYVGIAMESLATNASVVPMWVALV